MSQPDVRVDPGDLDASKEIAEYYRNTEQLNSATLQAIESILGEPSPDVTA